MMNHTIAPRCWIEVDHIGGGVSGRLRQRGKWFRRGPRLGASFRQVKMPALLTLDAGHRTISDSLVCLSVQGDTDRKAGRAIVPNDLNAADCLAAGPLSDGLQALFSESSVAHPDCSKSCHLKHFLEAKKDYPFGRTPASAPRAGADRPESATGSGSPLTQDGSGGNNQRGARA
jgi:hypothetical protein